MSTVFKVKIALLVLCVSLCANVNFAWADHGDANRSVASSPDAITLTSSAGTSVANNVNTVTITASGITDYDAYVLYDGVTSTCVGNHAQQNNNSGEISWSDISLKEGANQFKIYKSDNWQDKKTGSSLYTLNIFRAYATPPTPTKNESFTAAGSSDGRLDFEANGGTVSAPIKFSGLNPNATYYFIRPSGNSTTTKTVVPAANGTASLSAFTAKSGMDLTLKIDDGTGKPGEIVATMHLSQILIPKLVINPTSGIVCASGEMYILAQNVGDEYSDTDWEVKNITTNAQSATLSCYEDVKGHTLKLTNLSAGEYTVKLNLANGEKLETSFTALEATPLNRTFPESQSESFCEETFQTNATLPEGFTGEWQGNGVVDATSSTTLIKNPNGVYYWTAKNGGCEFTETWTFNNTNPELGLISTVITPNCGSATLSVEHKEGYDPKWIVDGQSQEASSSSTSTKSIIEITEEGTHSVTVTAGSGTCEQSRQTSVTVNPLNGFNTTEEEIVVCNNMPINISGQSVAGATKQEWTIVKGSGTILPNKSTASISVSGFPEGAVTSLEWKVEKDGCPAVKKKYIIKNGAITASGNSDILLCGTNNSTVINLNLAPGAKTIKWTNPDGTDATPSNNDKATQLTVTNIQKGSSTYHATVSNTNAYGCQSKEIAITIHRVTATASASPVSVCDANQQISLSGSPLSEAGAGATGYWTSSGGSFTSDISNNEATAKVNGSGKASFTWHVVPTITNPDGTIQTCVAEATASVSFAGLTGGNLVSASDFCTNNGEVTISVSVDASIIEDKDDDEEYFSFSNGGEGATKKDNTEKKTSVTLSDLPNGTTVVRWYAKTKSGCDVSAYITVVNLQPTAPHADKLFVCSDADEVHLTAEAPMEGATGEWYQAQGGATMTIPDSRHPELATLTFAGSSLSGVNKMRWNVSYTMPISKTKCTSKDQYVTVENLSVHPDAGSDIEVCNYDNNVLKSVDDQNKATLKAPKLPETTPVTTGKWSSTTGATIKAESSNETEVTGLVSGANEFVWTVTRVGTNGTCEDVDRVTVFNSRVDPANAGDDIYTCDDYTQLHAQRANDATTQIWSLASGHGYFSDAAAHYLYEKDVRYGNADYVVSAEVYKAGGVTVSTTYSYYKVDGTKRTVVTDPTIVNALMGSAGTLITDANRKSTDDDTKVGSHKRYEKAVTFPSEQGDYEHDPSPYRNQKFVVCADVYEYTYNGTSETIYSYYMLTNSERIPFNDGDAFPLIHELAGDAFEKDATNEVALLPKQGSGDLYDDTFVPDPHVVRLWPGKNTFRWTVKKQMLPEGNGCSNYSDVNVYYIPVKVDAGGTQHLCENHTNLQGTANLTSYTNIDGVTWTSQWKPSSTASIAEPGNPAATPPVDANLNTYVYNMAPGKNMFTLQVTVYHEDATTHTKTKVCEASDDVVIWNNEVGKVYAGEDDVFCGDIITDQNSNGSYRSYTSDYRSLVGSSINNVHNGTGVSGKWTVIGGNGNIVFQNSTSNVTSVTGLQRYMQDCTPDYWDTHTAANVFRWTVTYVNPETGEKCENSDDVQIIWLAPGDPDAGEDQFVCGNDVNLNPLDKGCGAQMTWWDFSGSSMNDDSQFNDEMHWANPYWGGKAFLNENKKITLDPVADKAEIDALVAAYGNEGEWAIKDHLVFTDVVYLDEQYYRIQTARDSYWNSTRDKNIHVGVSYTVWKCDANGNVAGATLNSYKEITGGAAAFYTGASMTGAPGTQLSLYQIADEVFNTAVYDMPSPADRQHFSDLSEETFKWYKHNELYSPKLKKTVSCTSWDEVKITNFGIMNDVKAGSEQAICNTETNLDASDIGTVFTSGEGNNVSIKNQKHYWTVVYGAGKFDDDESTKTNAHVTNLSFDTNIFRWNVSMEISYTNSAGVQIPAEGEEPLVCFASDDVYITNAQPSNATAGQDREVCDDHTVLSANLPVRSINGKWSLKQGDPSTNVDNSCTDQQCDAYITKMAYGPNTFTWTVTNDYYSPKNPSTVYAHCTVSDDITLYNHAVKADAGIDQFLCSDEVELQGNVPTKVGADGSFSSVGDDPDKPKGWWTQATTSAQYFHDYDDATKSTQNDASSWHVMVTDLDRKMNVFKWNLEWGSCKSDDEVSVYNNLPENDPNAGPDKNTCDASAELKSLNDLVSSNSWLEWTTSSSTVTFDGLGSKISKYPTTKANNLRSGYDESFTLTFYRYNNYKGMSPSIVKDYFEAIKAYDAAKAAYEQYLEDYKFYTRLAADYPEKKAAYDKYLEDMAAFNQYCQDYQDWVDGKTTTKPDEVPFPAKVIEPYKPEPPAIVAEPADTSKNNTTDAWAGKGFWKYYVEKGAEYDAAHPNTDPVHAPICHLEDRVVVHSNKITVTGTDYAACDYFDVVYKKVKDAKGNEILTTANNIFTTCVNKEDTLAAHPYGVYKHTLFSPSVEGGSKLIALSKGDLANFTGEENTEVEERKMLDDLFKAKMASVSNQTGWYALLWTQIDGSAALKKQVVAAHTDSVPTINNVTTPTPSIWNLLDGQYHFSVYAISMGDGDVCRSEATVTVNIHIPTMAAIEAFYDVRDNSDWTLDRTAICDDYIDMRWMTGSEYVYVPGSELPEGSTSLEPGKIAVPDNKEYSIFRVLNDDQGNGGNPNVADITFTLGKHAGGTQEVRASGLPYNGTNFELLNVINYSDSKGVPQEPCVMTDTITIFNNSVYADADIYVETDKSKAKDPDYKWKRQEVNLCTDEYTLNGNDPSKFDGNGQIAEYTTHGLWGFDDKDFKGYLAGQPYPSLENTTAFTTKVTGLLPSDNHQRANAFIWCVYKSIIPPPCSLETPEGNAGTIPSDGEPIPLKKACTPDTKAYEEDANGNVLYVDDKGNEYVARTLESGGTTFVSTTDYTTQVASGVKVSPKELELTKDDNDCFAWDQSTNKCLKFYTYDAIDKWEKINPEYAYKMKVISVLNFLKNSRITVNGGRHNYNYYVTEREGDPDNIYIWSDRQTRGARVGNNSAECLNKTTNKRETIYFGYVEDHTMEGHYFKGASIFTKNQFSTWMPDFNVPAGKYGYNTSKYEDCEFVTYDGGAKKENYLPWGWNNNQPVKNGVKQLTTVGDNFRKDLETNSIIDGKDLNGVSVSDGGYFETWANPLRDVTGVDPGSGKFGTDACTNNCNTAFYIWAMFGYGQPAKIPTSLLKHENGTYMNEVTKTNKRSKTLTNFAHDKGVPGGHDDSKLDFDVPLWGDVDNDGVGESVWTKAWHVTNIQFDDDAIADFIEGLEKDLEQYSAKSREPMTSTAVTVDDFKEEADNPKKKYWCMARDTVYIYNNTFYIKEEMPNFVACEETAELKGEEPGKAAGSSAKGYWEKGNNADAVTYVDSYASTDYVTKVTGLKPGAENQFTWHLERWGCKAQKDIYVYYNKVVSNAGDDVYTCTNEATLSAGAVQKPLVGHWEIPKSTDQNIEFDDNKKNDAVVSKLIQGDNKFEWVVERPFPEEDENGMLKYNGHTYKKQESCPDRDDMTVHNLSPDEAVIKTGDEIKPTPTPPGP